MVEIHVRLPDILFIPRSVNDHKFLSTATKKNSKI
jgi:hypothetical protein